MDSFQPISARPAPVSSEGLMPWLRANLFANPLSALTTLLLLAAFVWWLPAALDWLLLKAVWARNADACQAARGTGACWGVIAEKYRIIIFGRYPLTEQWRPEVATIVLVALLAHLENVGAPLGEALKISKLVRLEVHAPAAEVEKLRGPMAGLKPQFLVLNDDGFRRG
jgi:hypothetical protein